MSEGRLAGAPPDPREPAPSSTRSRNRLLGYAETLLAACCWGSSGVFAVSLFRRGVSPESVALLRPVIGVLLLAAVVALARRGALRVGGAGLLLLGLGGGIAVGVFQIAYQVSIDATGVPTTVALLYLAPAIVALASGPLLGEWPGRRRIALVALTIAGVWLTVLGAEETTSTFGSGGLGWGLLGAAAYAAYTLLGRHASPRFGSLATAIYSTAGACIFLAIVLPAAGRPVALPAGAGTWLILIAFSLLTIAGAQLLFFDALGRIEASGASVASSLEPVIAALLATVLLDQGLSALGWLGIALVVAGVIGVSVTESTAEKRSRSRAA
jgi:DME family drug/metabolite transporter